MFLWVFIQSITSISGRVESVRVLKKSNRTVKMSNITQADEQQETTGGTRSLQISKPFFVLVFVAVNAILMRQVCN